MKEPKIQTRNNTKLRNIIGKHAHSIQDHTSTRFSTHHLNSGPSFYHDKNSEMDLTASSFKQFNESFNDSQQTMIVKNSITAQATT